MNKLTDNFDEPDVEVWKSGDTDMVIEVTTNSNEELREKIAKIIAGYKAQVVWSSDRNNTGKFPPLDRNFYGDEGVVDAIQDEIIRARIDELHRFGKANASKKRDETWVQCSWRVVRYLQNRITELNQQLNREKE